MLKLVPPLILTAALGCAAAKAPAQPPAPAPKPLTRRQVVRGVLSHSVRVRVFDGKDGQEAASGVVIAKDAEGSYVITNEHVVMNRGYAHRRVEVLVDHGRKTQHYPAKVLAEGKAPEMDLALLQVKGVSLQPAELASDDDLSLGDGGVVAGAPFDKGLSLSGGMVSQIVYDDQTEEPTMLKTDAPIGYGASGGGIFSLQSGKLLAIVEGYRTAKVDFAVARQAYSFDVPMPGETFSSPTPKVQRFLREKGYGALVPPLTVASRAAPQPGS